jgi:hypothetical protein
MSLSVVDAIGIFGTGLGIIGFLLDNFPQKDPQGPVIRIKAGLADTQDGPESLVCCFAATNPSPISPLLSISIESMRL